MSDTFLYKRKGGWSRGIESVLIWEMLLFSGGVKFFLADQAVAMLLFLATAIVGVILNRQQGLNTLKQNIKIVVPIILWVLFCNMIANPMIDYAFITYIMFSLGTCLSVSFMDFDTFRHKLLKYLVILSVVGICVQLAHDYMGLSAKDYNIPNRMIPYGMSCEFFNTEWGTNRLSCIYWEPGQYQIVLIYTLCLFFKELCDLNKIKTHLKSFGVIIIALYMTQSTTGYLAFSILLIGTLFCSSSSSKYKMLMPLLFIIVPLGVYSLLNSSVVQEKFQEDNYSYTTRTADNLGMLMLIQQRPITGYGATNKEAIRLNELTGNVTQSNGWLNAASAHGLPYLVVISFLLYCGIKRHQKEIKPTLVVLSVLILSQAGEAMLFFPYLWMYIFKFRTYDIT